MVFDAVVAPRDRAEFMAWYDQQTKWAEPHGYQDPAVTTPELRAWFEAMAATFPPMNGPLASGAVDDPRITDYSIGRSVIYAAFAWSQARAAYQHMLELAAKHGVGFFDVSSTDGRIWLPSDGKLSCDSLAGDTTEAPQLGDPDYDLKSFGRDVGGGNFRWLATVLAVLAAFATIAIFAGFMSPPDNMNPTVGKVVIVGAALFWSTLAITNWWAWKKSRSRGTNRLTRRCS